MKITIEYEFDVCCGPMESVIADGRLEIKKTDEGLAVMLEGYDYADIVACPFCGAEITWEDDDED